MYRIELSPGDETVLRSIEELAVAVKRGVVTPRARIYHNASGTWLPIQLHPHYKTVLSMPLTQAALVAGPPVKPLASLTLQESIEPEPLPEPARIPELTGYSETAAKQASRSKQPAKVKRRKPAGKPRRELRIALVGALLIGGAQWVLSASLFSRADAPALLRAQRHLIAAPTEAMLRVSSPNSAAMMPVLSNPSTSPGSVQLEGLGESHAHKAPSFGGSAAAADEIPEVEPAPSTPDVSSVPVPSADSLRVRTQDSSTSKAPTGVLRSVSGARAAGAAAPSR